MSNFPLLGIDKLSSNTQKRRKNIQSKYFLYTQNILELIVMCSLQKDLRTGPCLQRKWQYLLQYYLSGQSVLWLSSPLLFRIKLLSYQHFSDEQLNKITLPSFLFYVHFWIFPIYSEALSIQFQEAYVGNLLEYF